MNLFTYVANNPVNWIDPYGLLTLQERLFLLGVTIYRFVGPIKVYVEGLGWIKPLPGIATFLGILTSPTVLSDPYLGPDGRWYWPDGTPMGESVYCNPGSHK